MAVSTNEQLLERIGTPADLRELPVEALPEVCAEVRQYIIDVLSETPGHLGASLGTVELTVALHYVFNTPFDRIVWDVGHQAYGHKILTGRKEAFKTLRKLHGISGFPILQRVNTMLLLPDMLPTPSLPLWGCQWLQH